MLDALVADEGADNALLNDREHGTSIVTVAMPSVLDRQARLLGNRLLELAHHASGRMILRIDAVRQFSSAWINEMLRLASHCDGLGGRLVVVGVNPAGMSILRATGLDRQLTLADDLPGAFETLGVGPRKPSVFGRLFGRGTPGNGGDRKAA